MSRSVSPPSSVTKTSPCWNGLIVPGSTLRYGSNFCTCTLRPRALSSRPSEAAVMPLPSDETTPPVTKTYLALIPLPERCAGACPCPDPRNSSLAGSLSPPPTPILGTGQDGQVAGAAELSLLANRGEKVGAAEHPLELLAALVVAEQLDARVRGIAGHL